MNYFVEIRVTVRRQGKPVLVPLQDVDKYTGFRSVFAYDEATRDAIIQAGSTAGLRNTAVHSDCLFVDFDGQDPNAFKQYLLDHGIAFEHWLSGGRSDHFHVSIEPMYGEDVPARQKAWVKEHATNADISFYHPAGVYRLPRTYHSKTGKQKALIGTYPGKPLVIPELSAKAKPQLTVHDNTGTIERYYTLLLTKKGSGHRSMHLFTTALAGFQAGLDWDTVMDGLQWMNARFDEPHQESVLELQCKGALGYYERSYGKAG